MFLKPNDSVRDLFANRRLRRALNRQRGLLTNIPGFKLFFLFDLVVSI